MAFNTIPIYQTHFKFLVFKFIRDTYKLLSSSLLYSCSEDKAPDKTISDNYKFRMIINQFAPVINKICFSYSNSKEDMADLKQDILINIWKGISNFRDESSLSTWVYRIAFNTAVSTVRKRYSRPTTLPIEIVTADYPDSNSDSDYIERVEIMHKLISSLSAVDRAIITMRLDDRSYDEIAEVVGINKNNVAVRLHRIKSRMQQQVSNINDTSYNK